MPNEQLLRREVIQLKRSSTTTSARLRACRVVVVAQREADLGGVQAVGVLQRAVWPLVGLEEKICKSDEIVFIVKTMTVCD